MNNAKNILNAVIKRYSIFLVLLVLFIFCSIYNPNFLTIENLSNISRQLSVSTILAFGATMLIIGGMLDLSAGSVLALSGVLAVSAYKATNSLIVSFIVGVLAGVICNILNAVMVSTFKTPPFIATLSMMTMARGFALFYTNGQNILQIGRFTTFGQGSIAGVPTPIIFLVIFFIITWYILKHTRFGRSLYAIGGNEEAALASGIKVKKIKYIAYAINGAFVGVAGILFMSRVNSALPNGAVGFEFQALTAAIIGGTSFSGGVGTAAGTLAGAFIVGFLDNIMNLSGVHSYIQQIIRGLIIALAVIYDIWAKNRRAKNRLVQIDKRQNEEKE